MRTIPWRALLVLSVALVFFSVSLAAPAAAQSVRKSITALTPAELMSLRRGVAAMMERNGAARGSADFRRSWVYRANMHGHFGSSCAGPISGSGMAGVQLWVASNSNETATWCKCEHHTDQFLTWHRMFLYYFERVLRQASGDPNLAVPYWDYATDSRLPPALRDPTYVNQSGQTVPNPLFVAARRPTINSGSTGISSSSASSANAMRATARASFSSRLEATPHGTLHCALSSGGCPTGLMGAVPAAALDPVFYLHHSNIDRLYECWLQVDETRRLPTTASVLNRRYAFIDSDGSVRNRRVRDMLTTDVLGYDYTTGAGCPVPRTGPMMVAEAQEAAPQARMAPMASGGSGFQIGRGTTEVPLEVEATGMGERAVAAPTGLRSAVVTIDGLTASAAPGVLFNVYLADGGGEREQVGVIDFFDFGGQTGAGGRHAGHGAPPQSYEFDATDAVRKLGLASTRRPLLIFEPTTGLTDSTPTAAGEAMATGVEVRFRRARLQVEQ